MLCRKSGKDDGMGHSALNVIRCHKHSYVWACLLKGAARSFLQKSVLPAVICVTQNWVALTHIMFAISGNKLSVESVPSL